MNIEETLKQRGSRYGDFEDHARITYGIKSIMQTGRSWHDMSTDKKEALDMIAHKIGRIVNGDPDYQDSWTDIIGYARLIEKNLYE